MRISFTNGGRKCVALLFPFLGQERRLCCSSPNYYLKHFFAFSSSLPLITYYFVGNKLCTKKTFPAFDRVFFHSIFTNFTVAGPIVADKEFFPVTALVFSSYSSNFCTVLISAQFCTLKFQPSFYSCQHIEKILKL